jgi:glutaredoxin
MERKRTVEVFSAGCPVCDETIEMVKGIACPDCEVTVLDLKDATVADRAKSLGIRSVPAVVIDGKLADCCAGRGFPLESVEPCLGTDQYYCLSPLV